MIMVTDNWVKLTINCQTLWKTTIRWVKEMPKSTDIRSSFQPNPLHCVSTFVWPCLFFVNTHKQLFIQMVIEYSLPHKDLASIL